jgi:hypothetical protein
MKTKIQKLIADYWHGEHTYDKAAHDRLVQLHREAKATLPEVARFLAEADRVWSGDYSQTRITHYLEKAAEACP